MKEFNLEEYLKNTSQKIVTRNGRDVRIMFTNMKSEYALIALITDKKDNSESPFVYTKNGRYFFEETNNDLFFASIKREGWVNVFDNFPKENHDYYCDNIYKTKEDAEKDAKKYNIDNYVTTTKIEWEE